jgi:hypothetical protein
VGPIVRYCSGKNVAAGTLGRMIPADKSALYFRGLPRLKIILAFVYVSDSDAGFSGQFMLQLGGLITVGRDQSTLT